MAQATIHNHIETSNQGNDEYAQIEYAKLSDLIPAMTDERRAKIEARRRRDQMVRTSLIGKGGMMNNGVRWWLDKPNNADYERHGDMLVINFGDPRAHGFAAFASNMESSIESWGGIEKVYQWALKEFVRILGLHNLEPAEPGDPESFVVKWKRSGAAHTEGPQAAKEVK